MAKKRKGLQNVLKNKKRIDKLCYINRKRQNNARLHVYTGKGEGKTLTAFGLALRALGHKQRVAIIQFMKGRKDIGEYMIRKKLGCDYSIHQFGTKEFIDVKKPREIDYKLAKKGFEYVKMIMKSTKTAPQLLVLDEINLAMSIGLLKTEEVLEFLKNIRKKTTIVLTGRNAPQCIMNIADLVTKMKEVRHPYRKGIYAKEGIEY